MDSRVIRRFVMLVAVATFVTFSVVAGYRYFKPPPGDYEVRKGDILLGDGKYDEALEWFDKALSAMPDHRGALMGRAVVYIQTGRYDDAIAELTYIIRLLKKTVTPDDVTGIGVLAAAYANRGIVHDRQGAYEKALADYIAALKTDEEAVSGPDLFYKILYMPNPSTVRKRAEYLQRQLRLPEDQRVLRVPELDDVQRMYKP